MATNTKGSRGKGKTGSGGGGNTGSRARGNAALMGMEHFERYGEQAANVALKSFRQTWSEGLKQISAGPSGQTTATGGTQTTA